MSDSPMCVDAGDTKEFGMALGKVLKKAHLKGQAPVAVLYGKAKGEDQVSSIFASMHEVVKRANTVYLGFAHRGSGERERPWTATRSVLFRNDEKKEDVKVLAVSISLEDFRNDSGTWLGIVHQAKGCGNPLIIMVPGASREEVEVPSPLVEQGGHAYIEVTGYTFDNLPQLPKKRGMDGAMIAATAAVNTNKRTTWAGETKKYLGILIRTNLLDEAGPAAISPEVLQSMLKSRDRNLRLFAMDFIAISKVSDAAKTERRTGRTRG